MIDGTIRSGDVLKHRSGGYWWTARLADQVVANSRSGLAAHLVPRRKGRVIHNGFDSTRIPPERPAAPPSDSPFKVVMAARMAPEKDFGTFLAAARHLHSEDRGADRCTLLAVGDGMDASNFLAQNEDLVRTVALEFIQQGHDVIGILQTAQVGVLLTDPRLAVEGCSNSILEYMACGLPVVCSRGGGNAEVVVEGETGFIVPQRDPSSLVDRLRFLVSHRQSGIYGRQGTPAGRTALLSAECLAQETLKTYREMVTNADGGAAVSRRTHAVGAR